MRVACLAQEGSEEGVGGGAGGASSFDVPIIASLAFMQTHRKL
jgi:hypothetical protein